MRKFLKNVLASLVGAFIAGLLLSFILVITFIGVIGVLVNRTSSSDFYVKENSVLTLNMKGVMQDRVTKNPLIDYLGYDTANEIALTDVLSAIKKAKDDSNISGIYINSGILSASSAALGEIRQQLEDFKESGKFVIAYADSYMQGCYYLASVADKIILNPQGAVDLHGLAVDRTFYKNMLAKIGIEMQVFKVGTYKSAVEPYILDKMSEANKEQVSSYANDMWASILEKISLSRNISTDQLNTLADTLTILRGSQFAIDNLLADTILYESEVKDYLKLLVGIDKSDDLNLVSVSEMTSVPKIDLKQEDEIAVLYAEGSIMSGGRSSEINDRYLIKQIEKIRKEDKIKAVVFRVNSPGGSAYASEQIWKAISDLKEEKPVIVSMGGVAASGGYYISCNATKIYAQPNTLTGSIGIFGIFPNIAGLANKIGVNHDGVKTNKMSDFGNISRPMNESEKRILQGYIEQGYDLFLTRCAEGRNIPKDSLNQIAQGRVWTGKQALSIGLVDALGGLEDAVKDAATTVGLDDYKVVEYPHKKTPFEALLDTKKEDITEQLIREYIGDELKIAKTIKEIKNLQEQDFLQARMPYDLHIE